jgi:hypothetical protein
MFSIQKAEAAWRGASDVGAADTSEGDEARKAHSAVVRALMARREGILVQVAEGVVVWMAFGLWVEDVSQRPALERVWFVKRRCSGARGESVLCFEVVEEEKQSCCGEGELLSKQEVAVVTALLKARGPHGARRE